MVLLFDENMGDKSTPGHMLPTLFAMYMIQVYISKDCWCSYDLPIRVHGSSTLQRDHVPIWCQMLHTTSG